MFLKKFRIKRLKNNIDNLKKDMLYLYKRGKDKDTINLLKAKKTKLIKLEEELYKLTKLEIKNGKLQPVEDNKEDQTPTQEELKEKVQAREVEMEAIKRREVEEMFKNRQEQAKEETVQQEQEPVQVDEPTVTEEDLARYREEEAIKQQLIRERLVAEETAKREAIRLQSREAQAPQTYKVRILLFPGTPVTIEIAEEDFKDFIDNIKEAINSQTTMYLGGNSVINGRYIIRYDILE